MQTLPPPLPPPPIIPPAPPSPIVSKLQAMEQSIADCLIERDDEARAMLRCLIAQEHLLLVGEPGSGKSMLCSALGKSISDAQSFDVLLTKYSTPEDVFGPISVQGLKADKYVRKTDGYMPTAHACFVDEVWKASTSILNSLLTIMNERVYDNGGARVPCPLRIMIGASNEWPSGEELSAAFDRFLVRRIVRPVSHGRLTDLLFANLAEPKPLVTIAEVDQAHQDAMGLPFTEEATITLLEILNELEQQGISVGDRRKRKAVKIAKADAYMSNASAVLPLHLEPLSDVLWQDPIEHPAKALEIVTRLANPRQAEVNRLLAQIDDLGQQLKESGGNSDVRKSVCKKLKDIEQTARAIGTPKAIKVAEHAKKQYQILLAAALNIDSKFANMVTGR